MKRKGLIVSSIVMVIVLIASLTTATYAWFSSTSQALLSQMTVNVHGAKGLTIGLLDVGAEGSTVTNGNVTWRTGDFFKGDVDGPGGTVNFANAFKKAEGDEGSKAHEGFFSVSGEGTKMYSAWNKKVAKPAQDSFANYEENNGLIGRNPSYVYTATPNISYFVIDLGITISNDTTTEMTVALKTLDISVPATTGNDMAPAARVALFAGNPIADATGVTTDIVNAYSVATNGVVCIEPYADLHKSGGAYSKSSQEEKPYLSTPGTFPTNPSSAEEGGQADLPIAYSQSTQCVANLSTTWAKKYYADKTSEGLDDTIGLDAITAGVTGEGALVKHQNGTGKTIKIATIDTNTRCIPVRLVIWFEGEDVECITGNASGGINISMEFERCTGEAPAK